MQPARTRLGTAALAVVRLGAVGLLALSGCSVEKLSVFGSNDPPPAPASSEPAAARISPPPVDLSGRWLLASPGSSQCGMTFRGAPGSGEGTIAPEGGCPGKFFTSRKWTFEDGSLIIRDHNSQALGTLAFANGRFDGQGTTGEPLTLTR